MIRGDESSRPTTTPTWGPAKRPRRQPGDTDARGKYSNPNAGSVGAGSASNAHVTGVIDKVDRKLGVDSGRWGSGPLGERRKNAVLSYQRMYNRRNPDGKITEDGIVGKQTLAALGIQSGEAGPRMRAQGSGKAIPPGRRTG